MASKLQQIEELDCCICNDVITDPRALPCGHSYCGPPRECLVSLKTESGMKCAVCRCDHDLSPEKINPLYGIRDFFPKNDEEDPGNQIHHGNALCSYHGEMATLWCKTCNVMICEQCLDVEHDEHSVRRLKRYLTEQIEKKLGNKLEDGLTSYQKQINETVETLNCLDDETQQAIRNYKLKSQRTRALVKQNLDKLSLVQEASAMLSIEEEKRERLAETSLLLRLSEMSTEVTDLHDSSSFNIEYEAEENRIRLSSTRVQTFSQCDPDDKNLQGIETSFAVKEFTLRINQSAREIMQIWGMSVCIKVMLHNRANKDTSLTLHFDCRNDLFPFDIVFFNLDIKCVVHLMNSIRKKMTFETFVTFSHCVGQTGQYSVDLCPYHQIQEPKYGWMSKKGELKFRTYWFFSEKINAISSFNQRNSISSSCPR